MSRAAGLFSTFWMDRVVQRCPDERCPLSCEQIFKGALVQWRQLSVLMMELEVSRQWFVDVFLSPGSELQNLISMLWPLRA